MGAVRSFEIVFFSPRLSATTYSYVLIIFLKVRGINSTTHISTAHLISTSDHHCPFLLYCLFFIGFESEERSSIVVASASTRLSKVRIWTPGKSISLFAAAESPTAKQALAASRHDRKLLMKR